MQVCVIVFITTATSLMDLPSTLHPPVSWIYPLHYTHQSHGSTLYTTHTSLMDLPSTLHPPVSWIYPLHYTHQSHGSTLYTTHTSLMDLPSTLHTPVSWIYPLHYTLTYLLKHDFQSFTYFQSAANS